MSDPGRLVKLSHRTAASVRHEEVTAALGFGFSLNPRESTAASAINLRPYPPLNSSPSLTLDRITTIYLSNESVLPASSYYEDGRCRSLPHKQKSRKSGCVTITTCCAADAARTCSGKSQSIDHVFAMVHANGFDVHAAGQTSENGSRRSGKCCVAAYTI